MTTLRDTNKTSLGFGAGGIVAALGMLVYFIHRNGFWIDELYTLHSIRLPWGDMVLERLRRGHFPGYFSLLKLIYEPLAAYNTETVLRSFSIICWVAAIASFVPLALRFAAPATVGIAILLLGLNGVVIRQAEEARMYTLVLLVAVWMTRAYFEMLHDGSSRKWGSRLALFTVLGFAVSASISMLSLGFLYDAFRRRRDQPALVRYAAIGLFLGLIVFLPGAFLHLATSDRLGIAGTKAAQLLAHIVMVFTGVQAEDDYFRPTKLLQFLQITGAAMTVLLLYLLWSERRKLPLVYIVSARAVYVPLALMLITEISSSFTDFTLLGPPRYLISILPCAALLTAYLFTRFTCTVLASAVVHVCFVGFLLTNAYGMLIVETENFREHVREMHRDWFRPGDAVVAVPMEIADGVEMYAPGVKVDEAVDRFQLDPAVLAKQLSPLRNRPRVILVYYRGRKSPILHVCEALFGPATSNRPQKAMGTLRVFRFRPELAGIEDQ